MSPSVCVDLDGSRIITTTVLLLNWRLTQVQTLVFQKFHLNYLINKTAQGKEPTNKGTRKTQIYLESL